MGIYGDNSWQDARERWQNSYDEYYFHRLIKDYLKYAELYDSENDSDDHRLQEHHINSDKIKTDSDDDLDSDSPLLTVKISTTGGATEIVDLADSSTYYKRTFPRLEDMAAVRLALDLWNHTSSSLHKWYSEWKHRYKFNELLESLQVPKCIGKRMKMLYQRISFENNNFYHYRLEELFDYEEEKHLDEYDLSPLYYPDEQQLEENYHDGNARDNNRQEENNKRQFNRDIVVWNSNCQIDVKKTVEKLLSCRKQLHLYGDQVFKIAADYCMENYVKNFPIAFLSDKFIQQVEKDQLSEHKMTYFWLKSKDPEYTLHPRDIFALLERSSLNWDGHRDGSQWSVYEYFWDFLTEDEQLTITKNLISLSINGKLQMELFSKLKRNQLEEIYFMEPYKILSNFCLLREYEVARASWQFANTTSWKIKSKEEFKKLVVKVLGEVKKTGEGLDFLIHLWSSVDDSYIEYAMNTEKGHIIYLYFLDNEVLIDTLEFLIVILKRKRVKFRKHFIINLGLALLYYCNEKIFTLVDTCFSQNDQLEIKEKLLDQILTAHTPTRNSALIRFKNLLLWKNEEFYKYLSLFTSKPNLQQRLKRRLVESKMLKISEGFFTAKEWSNVSRLLDESYPSSEQARKRKKKLLYWSVDGRYIFERWSQPYDEANFTVIDGILQSVLTENEIVSFKQRVSVCFQTALINGYRPPFRKAHWRRFTSWCFNDDEEKISKFRLSFPIHDVFHPILKETVNSYVNGEENCRSFFSIDELVRWKFPESNERKKFKELKIYDIVEVNLQKIQSASKKYGEVAEKFIQCFFEKNKAKIRQFKKLYSSKDRLKMISCVLK